MNIFHAMVIDKNAIYVGADCGKSSNPAVAGPIGDWRSAGVLKLGEISWGVKEVIGSSKVWK